MSSMDKIAKMRELEDKGWTSLEDGYRMKPPKELIEYLAQKEFYVYDAEDLQSYLDDDEG